MSRTINEFKSKFSPAQEVQFLRDEVYELNRKLEKERKETGEARVQILALTEAIERAQPPKMQYVSPKKTPSGAITYTLHLTDTHNGEVVNADEVDGFGGTNPEIATARLQSLAEKVIEHVSVQRAGYHIPQLQILGTADYVSGDIHEELKVTNAYPAPVQAVNSGYDLGQLVTTLAPHFEHVTFDTITLDNHGRMTRKPQAAQGGENNWSYVVAHIVRQHCSRLENVQVNIHAKASALVTVGPERYLMFHGHQIKGWAGIPYYGFDRRIALEAVKRMGEPETTFTKMVMGHFHVAVDAPHWIIGGSLTGTNAFDHSCGRHSPPHQTSWLVHEKHGQFGWCRWWL